MENKNFMALTDEELYEVNGGQGFLETTGKVGKAVASLFYHFCTQNDTPYMDQVYKTVFNNEPIKAPKVEFKYKDETHEKYVGLQKQVAEIKKSSNK